MALTTIAARFTDESVKLDGAHERRVLTTLKMIDETPLVRLLHR
jgi:hypothetical protein